MNVAEPPEDRKQDPHELRLLQGASPRQQLLKAASLLERHDHVGGIVVLEYRQNPHDVGVVEAGEGAGLLDEPVETPAKIVPLVRGNRMDRGVAFAHRELHRQVFLYRDLLIEILVVGEIGDTEPTLPEDALDPVPVHLVVWRQRVSMDGFGHRCESGDVASV